MSLDQRARVLEAVLAAKQGTRGLIQTLGWASSRTIRLLRTMEEEGLIAGVEPGETCPSARAGRGRPRKAMTCTPLGLDFLASYRKLGMKTLRARKADLAHATRDAEYASRLAAAGHAPFQLFLELNAIARHIEVSAAAAHAL